MGFVRRTAQIPVGKWTKWIVLGFWLVVIIVAFPLAGKLTGAEKNEARSWLPANAESTKVLDVQSHFQSPNLYPGVVVYERNSGLTGADRAKAVSDARKFANVHGIVPSRVVGPVPSKDGKALQTVVQANLGNQGFSRAGDIGSSVLSIARSPASGMKVHLTGPLGNAVDNNKVFSGIDSTLLIAALVVVIVILLVTYRSPVLWVLPVLCSGISLIAAQAVIYLLARHAGLTVNAQSAGILDVLVFGASTDYALLIVARYREELRGHLRRDAAMAEALRRAGPAVFASASTVVVALLILLVAELQSTKDLGPVLAIGVAVSFLAMLTLLPALLVVCPRGVFWPYRPSYGSTEPTNRGFWARVGWGIAPRPRTVWVTTAVVLGVMAIGLTGLQAHGLTNAQSFRGHPDSITGESVLSRHFPAGAGQPVVVVSNASQAPAVRSAFATTPGIAAVTPPVTKAGFAYMQGTLTSPPDSQAAQVTIDRTRSAVHAVPGANALVGGTTAINLDVSNASEHDRNLVIPLTLVVVLVILGLLLRSVVASVILTATVVLSFAAALGVSSLFFNHVFGFGGADTAFPLFVFVFLVALGIDYNIFLMTRVREEAIRRDARHGAIVGLSATGGVITSAGFVLAGTFAVLATIPSTFLTELGFAVAFGILLDTIVVRSVLVTALNLDLGRWMWWPSWLAGRSDPAPGELSQERTAALTRG
ncbi:MAG TPA: MMPL family transporter [Streptosporangiaceae bacterium]|nr:MMPL family transporter [Streptosporangiaceae bacterium]